MSLKLLALAMLLAALIPHRATAAGLTVHAQVAVLIVLLAAAAGGLAYAFRGGIGWRWASWQTVS
jgi:hypothetical protein